MRVSKTPPAPFAGPFIGEGIAPFWASEGAGHYPSTPAGITEQLLRAAYILDALVDPAGRLAVSQALTSLSKELGAVCKAPAGSATVLTLIAGRKAAE